MPDGIRHKSPPTLGQPMHKSLPLLMRGWLEESLGFGVWGGQTSIECRNL